MTALRVSTSGTWVIAGTLGSSLKAVVGFRVIGETVDAAVFGHAALSSGATLLVASLGAGPIAQASGRHYFNAGGPVERNRLLWSGVYLVGAGLVAGLGVLAVLTTFGWVLGGAYSLLAVALAMQMIRTFWSAWLQWQARFALVAIAQLTDTTLRPIAVVLLADAAMPPVNIVLHAYARWLLCKRLILLC
jgi:hypothetical protein